MGVDGKEVVSVRAIGAGVPAVTAVNLSVGVSLDCMILCPGWCCLPTASGVPAGVAPTVSPLI